MKHTQRGRLIWATTVPVNVAVPPQAPWERPENTMRTPLKAASFLFKKAERAWIDRVWLGCVVAPRQRAESKQTMAVIERWNRWHYRVLITSFAHRHRTLQLLGYEIHVCVLERVCIKGLEMTGSSGSHSGWKKVVSGYQRSRACLDGSSCCSLLSCFHMERGLN